MRISDWSSDVCSSDLGYAIMRGAVQYPFREYVYRSLMLAALSYAVTNLYGASPAQMIVTGLPHEFASILGGSPDGVGGSFAGIWARSGDALLALQDATENNAAEHAPLPHIPGFSPAIMLSLTGPRVG